MGKKKWSCEKMSPPPRVILRKVGPDHFLSGFALLIKWSLEGCLLRVLCFFATESHTGTGRSWFSKKVGQTHFFQDYPGGGGGGGVFFFFLGGPSNSEAEYPWVTIL